MGIKYFEFVALLDFPKVITGCGQFVKLASKPSAHPETKAACLDFLSTMNIFLKSNSL